MEVRGGEGKGGVGDGGTHNDTEGLRYKCSGWQLIHVQSGYRTARVSHMMIGLIVLALLGAAGKAHLVLTQRLQRSTKYCNW